MFTVTMSTRGQLVLPKEVRERLKLLPGCKVEGAIDAQGRIVLSPALYGPEELLRDRPKAARRLSVAAMNRVIRKAAGRGRL